MLPAAVPRLRFAHLPTPLEPLERLTRHLGGPQLFIKRDDCTGLATGGNKTRKLEFWMADVIAQGADVVLTQGALQSNHTRQTTAITARLGLECELLLQDQWNDGSWTYQHSGNLLLDRLHGARVSIRPPGTDLTAATAERADDLRRAGRRPYIIPVGGSGPPGCLGYACCAAELLEQAKALGIRIDAVVLATGSGGTQAGLVLGFEQLRSGVDVLGISVRWPRDRQIDIVHGHLAASTALYELPPIPRHRVLVDSGYVGPGYGAPAGGTVEALELLARTEGILLDPVYSAKGMDGLIDLVRQGRFTAGQNLVFLHTGGVAGLFAYSEWLAG